jgi:hypothetical protein
MHSDDQYILDNNSLVIGIYIHEVCGSDELMVEIGSIQSAKLVHAGSLCRLMNTPNVLFSHHKIRELKTETWYVLDMRIIGDDDFHVMDIAEAGDQSDKPWLTLH